MEGSTRTEEPQAPDVAEPDTPGVLRGPREDTKVTSETPQDLIRQAADGQAMTPDQVDTATEWFLSDEEDPDTEYFEMNVGSTDEHRWIGWTIRSVDTEVLKRIRRQGENRASRRRGGGVALADIDPVEANARIVLEGTLKPDLFEVARKKGVQDTADPSVGAMQVLKHRFRRKPGLIDQIAGRIMDLSGYNEDDLREAEAAKN